MRYLRGWFGDVRLWVRVALHLIRPQDITNAPEQPGHVQPLLTHRHVWGSCKWSGQYWYARCVAYEWCTARIAC